MQMQQQDRTPQQQAMYELHSRYERGDLSFEDFEGAFDKILQARSAEESWAVLEQLPSSSMRALQARELSSQPPAMLVVPTQWMVSLMGEIKRIRLPWRMAQQTTVFVGLGEVELDLSIAALPQQATLQVYMLAGEVKIYVPRSINVTVSTTAVLGEVSALGQKSEGIIAHSSHASAAEDGMDAATRSLDIQAHILLGEVKIVQVDAPVVMTKMKKKGHKKDRRQLKYEAGYVELPRPK